MFVVTGPSGAGKTTLVNLIRSESPSDVEVRDLDAYFPDVARDDAWRLSAYRSFLDEVGKRRAGTWILAGQVLIEEFDAVAAKAGVDDVRYIEIRVADEERASRLRGRGWAEKFIAGQTKWADANINPGGRILQSSIDSSHMSPERMKEQVLQIVNGGGDGMKASVKKKEERVKVENAAMVGEADIAWRDALPKVGTMSELIDVVTNRPAASYFDIYHPLPFSGISSVRTAVDKAEFWRKTQTVLDGAFKHLSLGGKAMSSAKIIDVGANGGGLSFRLAQSGAQVVAAEADLDYVELGKAVARLEKVDMEWRHATLDSVVQEGDHFDLSLVLSVFQWAAMGGKSIEQAGRSLRKLSECSDSMIFELGFNFGTQCLTTEESDHYAALVRLLLDNTVYTDFSLLTVTELYPGQKRFMVYCSGKRQPSK